MALSKPTVYFVIVIKADIAPIITKSLLQKFHLSKLKLIYVLVESEITLFPKNI